MTTVVAPAMQIVSPDVVAMWAVLRLKMHPVTSLLTINGPIFNSLNAAEKDWIRAQYRAIVAEDVTYVRDGRCDRFFLSKAAMFPPGSLSPYTIDGVPLLAHPKSLGGLLPPPPPPSYSSGEAGGIKLAKSSKILRPPNAFILYRKANHESVKAAHPGIHNNQISVILGTQWQEEDAAVRAEYKAEALQLKMEHMLKYPDYQYQPRKSSELKRRMTKKKAAAAGQPKALVEDFLGLGSSPQDHDFSQVSDSWFDIGSHDQPSVKHGVQAGDLLKQAQFQNGQQTFAQPFNRFERPEVSVGDNEWLMSFPREYEIPWAIIDAKYPQPELEDKYNPWI